MRAVPVAVEPPQAAVVLRAAAPDQHNQPPVAAIVALPAQQVGRIAYVPRDPHAAPVHALEPPLNPIDIDAVHRAAAVAQAANADLVAEAERVVGELRTAGNVNANYRIVNGKIHYQGIGRGRHPRRARANNENHNNQNENDEQRPVKRRRRVGKNASISDQLRQSIVNAKHDFGQSPLTISQVTGVNQSTVRSVLHAFNQRGHSNKLSRGGNHRPVIPPDVREAVLKANDDNNQVKLRVIREQIQQQNLAYIPSLSSIDRILDQADQSLKLAAFVPMARNEPAVIEKRREYGAWAVRHLLVDDIPVYIDEFGCNVSMRSRKARSKRGEPAIVRVDGLRNRNLSVLVAMSPVYGILSCQTRIQAFDGETFANFLKELAEKLKAPAYNHRRFVFIMDNAKFHLCEEVKALIPRLGFDVKYLPPYSPFLNPIEECFSKWKGHMKDELAAHVPAAPENADAKVVRLTTAASNAMRSITAGDCLNWNAHSKEYWADCADGIPINV